jgi:hypothetical protein
MDPDPVWPGPAARVEKFGQVNIHNEPIAFDDLGLRLRHRLVGGAARPEAVAVLAECRVPQRLKPQIVWQRQALPPCWHPAPVSAPFAEGQSMRILRRLGRLYRGSVEKSSEAASPKLTPLSRSRVTRLRGLGKGRGAGACRRSQGFWPGAISQQAPEQLDPMGRPQRRGRGTKSDVRQLAGVKRNDENRGREFSIPAIPTLRGPPCQTYPRD